MKEHPILFSTPMVQAILVNRKKMTRRTKGLEKINENPDNLSLIRNDKVSWIFVFKNKTTDEYTHATPAYKKGHKLWVRETWFYADGDLGVTYKADYTDLQLRDKPTSIKWKPSLFMKKEIARIWLEVTNVRCERLQDITEADAIAEGVIPLAMSSTQIVEQGQKYFDYSKPKQLFVDGLDPFWSFNSLWCSINGGESWDHNPWVFIYEFKRIERP